MPNTTTQTENQVRIFRDNPFAWYDKEVMRYLRKKYGHDKKKFLIIRAVYTALTEIESDFKEKPINFFTKTVGTYAGVSREVAGKYLNLLEKEALIKKLRERDPKTRKFLSGTTVHMLSLNSIEQKQQDEGEAIETQKNEPLSGYPGNGSKKATVGIPQRRDTRANNKEGNTLSETKFNVNENLKIEEGRMSMGMSSLSDIMTRFDTIKHNQAKNHPKKEKPEYILKRDYLAQEIADTFSDQKSLGFYRKAAEVVPEPVMRDFVANIKETQREGKIRKSRGALLVHMILQYCEKNNIDLGIKNKATHNTV